MVELKANQVAFECRKMGEDQVRHTVAQGGGSPDWIRHAKEWLAGIDHDRNVASQAEILDTAKTANTIATLALTAAVIAMALSIIAIFLR